jgi:Domain of unknown function (DUF4652)
MGHYYRRVIALLEIEYDFDEQIIYLIDRGHKKVLESDMPSEPEYSPNESKIVYISPLEWECIGNLYIVDLKTGEKKTLIKPEDDKNIPKQVIWIDEETLGVIMGFGHGTVAVGGNVNLINLNTGILNKFTDYPPEIQITKMELKDNETLFVEGIRYIDNEFNRFVKFEESLSLNLYI